MRVSQHSGREGSAKHNDRSFDTTKAEHIDATRTKDNITYKLNGLQGDTLEAQELDYYRKTYGAGIEARNARYIAQRHPERCRTAEDFYRAAKTRPEEMILQIGSHVDGSADREQLRACLDDYLGTLQAWNREHGHPFQILDAAVHVDETTPHIHVRRVWNAPDKDGNLMPGQNAALERAGVPFPDPGKPVGRYNNRKMTFDAWARGQWQEIARSHGFQIETEPIKGRKHLSVDDKARELSVQARKEQQQAEAARDTAVKEEQMQQLRAASAARAADAEQERGRKAAEYLQHTQEAIDHAKDQKLQALRERDAARADADVEKQLSRLKKELRADPVRLPEPLETLPAVEKGLFRAEQPERVVLPARDYERAGKALTALKTGKQVAASMDESARIMTAAARETRRNRMDAETVAINDRVQAAEDRADGLERTLDDTRRQLARVEAERDEARQDLADARDAAQQMQELQRLFPDTFIKMDRQRRHRALEYAYDNRDPHDPPVLDGKKVNMYWLLRQYRDECERTGRQPRQDMTEHLARIERNRGIER